MKFSLRKLAPIVASTSVFVVAVSSTAIAQDGTETNGDSTVDIAALTCRDLLLMDGEDEESAILFVQGYINGKSAETLVDTDAVKASSDRSLEQCIDEPDSTVLSVFEQNR